MEEVIGHVLGVILPVMLCVLVGYALALLKLPFDNKVMAMLLANVGYPTLIVSHLSKQHVPLGAFMEMMLAVLAVVVCFALIGSTFLLLMGLPLRAYFIPNMLNNAGNIGLPVCALALGNQGLAYAMAFVIVILIISFTVGTWVPRGKITLGDVFRKPVIYAVILAIVLMATQARLPSPIDSTFDILGGFAIPLMLITLGHTLATLNLGMLWQGAGLALLHLLMAAGVTFGLLHVFEFEDVARSVFILMCMMPIAVTPYLWVELYDPDEAPGVASFILVSTLLSIIVLPLVLAFWI